MFSPTTLVCSGIGAIVGCIGGGAFAISENIVKDDNTLKKIAKIASIALLAGTLVGSLILGLSSLAAVTSNGYVALIVAIVILKNVLT